MFAAISWALSHVFAFLTSRFCSMLPFAAKASCFASRRTCGGSVLPRTLFACHVHTSFRRRFLTLWKHKNGQGRNCPSLSVLAFPAGFEPTTFRLGGGRSILLSYGNILLTLSYCRRPRALCQALPPREAEPRLNMRLCYFCIKGPDIAAINRRWLRVLPTEPLLLTKILILSNKHARCTIT